MSTDSPMRTAETTMTTAGTDASFGPLKQIDAGLLSVGYAEAGPPDSPAVILLHGWPYDIHGDVDVTPLLASAGYRVTVPYLRGYGTTRFLPAATLRNGQQAALGVDVVALMDALGLERAIIADFGWGARTEVTRMAHHTRIPPPTPGSSPAGTPPAHRGWCRAQPAPGSPQTFAEAVVEVDGY